MSKTIYWTEDAEAWFDEDSTNFDEERIDAIGRNGGEGLHYDIGKSVFHDGIEFLDAGDTPYPNLDTAKLYEKLVVEEFNEWRNELEIGSPNDVKEALDLLYVVTQYLNAVVGPDKAKECWDLLHENNMSKCVDGKLVKRSDGKILKNEYYVPLDLSEVL